MAQDTLDKTLQNFQESSLTFSEVVKTAIEKLDENSYDFPSLIRASKQHAETLQIFIDAAPFFAVKQSMEGTDRFRDWLLTTPEYVGQKRADILEAIAAYQDTLLADTDLDEKQITLI